MKTSCNRGFSLLEIIAVLIIASIMGAMLFSLLRNQIIQSHMPMTWTREEFTAYGVMEKVTADYEEALKQQPFSLDSFRNHVAAAYGAYAPTLTFTDFQCTDAGCPESGTNANILKVTMQNGDQIVSALFTQ